MVMAFGFAAGAESSQGVISALDGETSEEALGNWDNRFGPLGMNNSVRAIAVSGSDVYVGGTFTQAGGVDTPHIACWVPPATSTEPRTVDPVPGGVPCLQASPNPMTSGTNLFFESIGVLPLTLSIYDT